MIEDDVKLDNQIQIGHNCMIGAHTAIAGCAGIAGSTRIGRNCRIGGAAMISGHLDIAGQHRDLGCIGRVRFDRRGGRLHRRLPGAAASRAWRASAVAKCGGCSRRLHGARSPALEQRAARMRERDAEANAGAANE